MPFFLFSTQAFASPIVPIHITTNKTCAPILYELLPTCRVEGEAESSTVSAFVWKESLWTTHANIAGASTIQLRDQTTLNRTSANPLVDYAQFEYTPPTPPLKTVEIFNKGDVVICIGLDAHGQQRKTSGQIHETNISIHYNRHKSPPLLEITCPMENTMAGGIVLNEQEELIGMLLTQKGQYTYALPHTRLQSSSYELGLSIQKDHVVYSLHTEIPVGAEIFGIVRSGKRDGPPFPQLLEGERIRVQLSDDDVSLRPIAPQHNAIMLLEEEEGQQHVLKPSHQWAKLGLRAQDRWFPQQNKALIRIKRNEKILYVLSPDWWRNKNKK